MFLHNICQINYTWTNKLKIKFSNCVFISLAGGFTFFRTGIFFFCCYHFCTLGNLKMLKVGSKNSVRIASWLLSGGDGAWLIRFFYSSSLLFRLCRARESWVVSFPLRLSCEADLGVCRLNSVNWSQWNNHNWESMWNNKTTQWPLLSSST